MTTSQINYFNLVENKRHNVATEKEVARANKAQEGLRNQELGLTSARNEEQMRTNKANELINHNKALEQQRSNLATEAISYDINRIRENELQEKARATDVNAAVSMANLAELARHNVASEDIQSAFNIATNTLRGKELYETNRANIANENIKRVGNLPNIRQAGAAETRNAISSDTNALTKRGQNLGTLTDLYRTTTQGLTSIIGTGARALSKGGF